MSSLGSPSTFFLAKKKAYEVERSLRFDPNDTYMERTSSGGNRKTFTISLWFKLGILKEYSGSDGRTLFGAGGGGAGSSATNISLLADVYGGPRLDFLSMLGAASGSNYIRLTTLGFIRDPSAWYHVVVKVDTPQGNSPNRAKMYINGDEVSDWYNYDQPDQNADTYMNAGDKHGIGANRNWSNQNVKYNYFGGYIAEFHFLDGTAYDASYFGETDIATGQWIPKKYTGGNYGTNGFYLNFSDNSGTTATTLGKDLSGNSNNYTPYNFSVAAGAGNDSVPDSPTNNFCTFNPLKVNASYPLVFSNGNLQHNGVSGGNHLRSSSTMQVNSGKWYVEFKFVSGYETTNSTVSFGLTTDAKNNRGSELHVDAFWYQNTDNFVAIAYRNNGVLQVFLEAVSQSTLSGLPTFVNGDVMGLAVDLDNDKLFVSKNGTFFSNGTGTQDPAAGTNPVYSGGFLTSRKSDGFYFSVDGYSDQVVEADFGQQGYAYTPPSGFKKVSSANLPDPTILLPNQHFNTVLYTGNNNTSQNITGVGFSPDWVWVKNRDNVERHHLVDSVRGDNKVLHSENTDAERTGSHGSGHTQLNLASDGFNLVSNGSNDELNFGTRTYVAWNWNAGDTDGKTYTVKVVSDSGNKYRFDDFGTSAVTLDLAEGGTYIFDQSDSSNSGHPLRFYTAADKTGGEYTTGVTTVGTPGSSGAYTQIVVAASAPTLFYQCSLHAGMGGQANTNSTLGSSNFDGSIQSTVKVNATAGFSILTYTGTGSNATIGHGLGVTANAIIVKRRNGTQNWGVYHSSVAPNDILQLDVDNAVYGGSGVFGNALATSSVFSVNAGSGMSNGNGDTYVAYCFSEVAGYSKFGSYTGNGSTDGPFVFTGFRPAFLLWKNSSSVRNWHMIDNTRDTFNPVDLQLYPNLSTNEYAETQGYDFLSNGFKIRESANFANNNGGTYIYLAFAESPFKNARAR